MYIRNKIIYTFNKKKKVYKKKNLYKHKIKNLSIY